MKAASTQHARNRRSRPGSRCTSKKVSLPVLKSAGASPIAKSRASKWRAVVLVGVHLLIIAHVVHWLVAGRTLTPVEPSESMETIKYGYVNAGFIFFLTAIVATLFLGRWVCGWACHVVAYQDLCGWLLRKAGFKPKPFRSRLLIFVPLGAALYMFVWPAVYMWLNDIERQPATNHLTTANFWRTFPGLFIALLTVGVCGFLIVYLLGNKGFCTYACPYGGFFGVVDQFAVGRIRVTDACEHCGHCTSVCTSNVKVHAEVRDYGMVVDPGCMKCLDCVTVCPNDALYYGFGRPGVAAARRTPKPTAAKHYDFSWPEELFMAAAFLATLLIFRGLYNAIPFLLSLGIAAISAYLLLQLVRLVRSANVRLHTWQLKRGGAMQRAGWAFAGVLAAWIALSAHSGIIQYHAWRGGVAHAAAAKLLDGAVAADDPARPAMEAAADRSYEHYAVCDRWGLFGSADANLNLARVLVHRGEFGPAEARLKRVIELAPRSAESHYRYGNFLGHRGRFEEALASFERAVQADESHGMAQFNFGRLLAASGRLEEAAAAYRKAMSAGVRDVEAQANLAGVLAALGRIDEAITEYERLAKEHPELAEPRYNAGVLLLNQGKTGAAIPQLSAAAKINPNDAQTQFVLGQALLQAGRPADAAPHLRRACELDSTFCR